MCEQEHDDSGNCWCNPVLFYEDERTEIQVWVHICSCEDGQVKAETLVQAIRKAMFPDSLEKDSCNLL